MRILQIEINNLFGIFDYQIPLNEEERITIIHGLNGLGKTTILRLINSVFSQKFHYLLAIPFNELHFTFDDSSRLTILRTPKSTDASRSLSPILIFKYRPHNHSESTCKYSSHEINLNPMQIAAIREYLPELRQVDDNVWSDRISRERITTSEVLGRLRDRLPLINRGKLHIDQLEQQTLLDDPDWNEIQGGEIPEWLTTLIRSVSIHLIETQRLLEKRPRDAHTTSALRSLRSDVGSDAVSQYARDLSQRIGVKRAESGLLAQTLDTTFPARIIQKSVVNGAIGDVELSEKLDALVEKRYRLIDLGLLEQADDKALQSARPLESLDPNVRSILEVYADDTEKKLSIFDDIARKIEVLRDIVNKRFLYKKMEITQNEGIIFELPNGIKLRPFLLSSGEQHELVLFYELLFVAKPNALILIDEPELSLHVSWEHEFLHDIREIVQLANIDVLIATHSPQIINGEWELTVALEGPKQ